MLERRRGQSAVCPTHFPAVCLGLVVCTSTGPKRKSAALKVALITNIPSPYRYPTWDALAGHVESLTVFVCSMTEANRIWKTDRLGDYRFDARVLPGRSWYVPQREWGIHINPTLLRELADLQPSHIIVTGYDVPSYWLAIWYAKRHGIPLTIWWGSHSLSSRSNSGPIAWVRRWILRHGDAFVTYGQLATQTLVSLGIPPEVIETGTNSVDVTSLCRAVDPLVPAQRTDGPVRFLYVGQFIDRKGVMALLQAFTHLPPEEAELTLVGYGPQEAELKSYALHHDRGNVTFAGATRSLEETAKYYAEADVFVMPSHSEVWGLVVNEALASGLMVISSKYAGATPDLITQAPLFVGLSVDPSCVKDLASALERLVSFMEDAPPTHRRAVAAWGRQQTPEQYAEAIQRALARSHPGADPGR